MDEDLIKQSYGQALKEGALLHMILSNFSKSGRILGGLYSLYKVVITKDDVTKLEDSFSSFVDEIFDAETDSEKLYTANGISAAFLSNGVNSILLGCVGGFIGKEIKLTVLTDIIYDIKKLLKKKSDTSSSENP